MNKRVLTTFLLIAGLLLTNILWGQDPVGAIEGVITDGTMSPVADAKVTAMNLNTGFSKTVLTEKSGLFRIPLLPVGQYSVTAEAPKFGTLVEKPVVVNVTETVRLELQLQLATIQSIVNVTGERAQVDSSTNTVGAVVTGREIVDLPLNVRNFTQLGLLQTGAAPLTSGLKLAGGALRQGETYAVNGARPEQNMYVVDGAQNINRMDGGWALQVPVDAIAEFRILTQTAPPEYGGTGGATTTVVTKSGTNDYHGSLYEFIRNDDLDTRNFFRRRLNRSSKTSSAARLAAPSSATSFSCSATMRGCATDKV